MMTRLKPVKAEVGKSGVSDFYIVAGEPIGMRHLCPSGTKYFFGLELEIGEQVRLNLTIDVTTIGAEGA